MKFSLTLFVIAAIIATAFCSDCEKDGQKFAINETYTPETECVIYTCADDGVINGKICPAQPVPANCELVPGSGKVFPDCCEELKCD